MPLNLILLISLGAVFELRVTTTACGSMALNHLTERLDTVIYFLCRVVDRVIGGWLDRFDSRAGPLVEHFDISCVTFSNTARKSL